MMKLEAGRSVLLVVDIQEKLAPAISGGDSVIDRTLMLMQGAEILEVPVLATEQAPASIGSTVKPVADRLATPALPKVNFNAMAETETVQALAGLSRDILVIVGMEAHVCVLQTALGALERGYQVAICADAAGSRDPANHILALDRFHQAGGGVVSSEMVLFEWLARSDRPEFKEVLELIK